MSFETLILKEITIFPELFLGISLVYLILHGSLASIRKSYPVIQNSMIYLGVLILGLCLILLINEHLYILDLEIFNNTLSQDFISFASKLVINISALICVLMIQPYLIYQRLNQFEYIILILFSILGLFLLCSANDLITAYLAMELQTLSFYVLAAFNRQSTFSIDAGIKYFILGSVSSALFLFGSSLIYGLAGTINFSELKDLFLHCSSKTKNEISLIDSLSELHYHSLLMSNFKYDLSVYFMSDISKLHKFSLLKDELLDINCLINQLVSFSSIFEKYNCILLTLIMYFKNFELGFLLYELYNFKDLLNLNEDSGFLMILNICEITNAYIDNLVLPIKYFNLHVIEFALLFILISLFFKLAIVPFHSWAPDVYEGSPSSSAFFFSVVPKVAIFILMLRIFYFSFHGFFNSFKYIIACSIFFSVLVGSLGGLEQRKFKSLLVYSSISHMGYSLIVFNSGVVNNLQTLFCYLIIYSFSSLCIWSIFIFTRVKINRLRKQNKDLTDFVLMSKANYTLAIFLSIILFSVAGFPPMVGFLVKINVFSVGIESSMYFIVIISILCSVIATFFYIRIIKIIFFEKVIVGKLYHPITTEKVFILSILLWFSLFLFLNPTLLFLFSHKFSLLF